MKRRPPTAALLGLLFAGGSCLFGGAHDRCHQRALEQLGCCPFHGEECELGGVERIREACAEELADGQGTETSAPADAGEELPDESERESESEPEEIPG